MMRSIITNPNTYIGLTVTLLSSCHLTNLKRNEAQEGTIYSVMRQTNLLGRTSSNYSLEPQTRYTLTTTPPMTSIGYTTGYSREMMSPLSNLLTWIILFWIIVLWRRLRDYNLLMRIIGAYTDWEKGVKARLQFLHLWKRRYPNRLNSSRMVWTLVLLMTRLLSLGSTITIITFLQKNFYTKRT